MGEVTESPGRKRWQPFPWGAESGRCWEHQAFSHQLLVTGIFFFQGRFGASCKVSGGALAFKERDLFRTGEVPAGDFLDSGGPGTL